MFGDGGTTLREVPPREVNGYASAAAAGLLTRVPHEPPLVLAGPTALQAFRSFLAKSAVTVVAVLVLSEVIQRTGLPGAVAGLGTLVIGLTGLGLVVLRFWREVGRRSAEELECGYTTLVLTFGWFQWSEGHPWAVGRRAPWDYTGVWVLDGTARRVLAAPDRSVDPPGFYPSPHRPGSFELWTGAAWSGQYRPDPRRGMSG